MKSTYGQEWMRVTMQACAPSQHYYKYRATEPYFISTCNIKSKWQGSRAEFPSDRLLTPLTSNSLGSIIEKAIKFNLLLFFAEIDIKVDLYSEGKQWANEPRYGITRGSIVFLFLQSTATIRSGSTWVRAGASERQQVVGVLNQSERYSIFNFSWRFLIYSANHFPSCRLHKQLSKRQAYIYHSNFQPTTTPPVALNSKNMNFYASAHKTTTVLCSITREMWQTALPLKKNTTVQHN